MILGYWNICGLIEPSRMILRYTKTPFINQTYAFQDGPNYATHILRINPFPNLPYLIDGDIKLTQSKVILRHLGRKFNMMGKTEKEIVICELLIDQLFDLRTEFNKVAYGPVEGFEEAKQIFINGPLTDLEKLDQKNF
ncbi:unnamed protein product [Didymodactylos carnosus]|uniref:glutathione transferase n=1 Tax=Didymodactylos carnosus TaxID=1234261 RepID=A0A814QGL2_9BILA|nr:unnamed protein product [Didymodactylos carnosus]CAF1179964.1 unnamed protein product [Didymodactylos carnosus]CAF3882028.1 unnamed protein product [Didymodactylos carnosus]CAF3991255.1 unnamed protein product [Didymodactylos carnosus]